VRLEYDVVDVFTDRAFAGNQLAVVHGGGDLSTEQCLALAQEFGYSETTFPVPAAPDEYAVRIFTPGGEIPFAGHPTLGSAWVLRARSELAGGTATQLCGAGRIEVHIEGDDEAATVELAAAPRDLAGPLPGPVVTALLADLGLSAEAIDGDAWVAGAGLSFVYLPVRADVVSQAVLPSTPLSSYGTELTTGCADPVEGIDLYAVSGDAPGLDVHARVFVPGLSIAEDAATGSAAAGLGMVLVASGVLPDGGRYTVSQGAEMGRPSTLHGRVDASDGSATRCHVAGAVQPVASGSITVP
jgi:trans-2,3-dihydro-3-hydroxyanthranilate isomerase